MLRYIILAACGLSSGCSLLPEIAHQPTLHNPFPQLSKVAVAPFFNLSTEPTVDGRRVALAYFNELQLVPGYEVVPVEVTERAMQDHHIALNGPADARLLAQFLNVDAVVIGAVTDYTPYYPPRMGMQVEWYAANPGFHPIPPGYGLPWGTPEECDIPAPLVFEAELALARAQLKTQTPPYEKVPCETPAANGHQSGRAIPSQSGPALVGQPAPQKPSEARPASYQVAVGGPPSVGLPPDWPDPRGFIPPPPLTHPPAACPSDCPVMRHTRLYNGHDGEFTEALSSYYFSRDDARIGGWQSYEQRSEDFIRFCCHMHISEMLSARGGAGETRVVWRWPTIR
jgi:hypothetical protein